MDKKIKDLRPSRLVGQILSKYESDFKKVVPSVIGTKYVSEDRYSVPGSNPGVTEGSVGPTPPALRLVFKDSISINSIVGDPTVVSNWNTWFKLPTYGTPFTSVSVDDATILLYGGANITLWNGEFDYGDFLHQIDDQAGCIVSLENSVFLQNFELTLVNLPKVINVDFQNFAECLILTSINLSSCTNLGGTVGNNDVFRYISGNNITLTIPSVLMTCNAGNPDGDIQYLQANNTVTVVTV